MASDTPPAIMQPAEAVEYAKKVLARPDYKGLQPLPTVCPMCKDPMPGLDLSEKPGLGLGEPTPVPLRPGIDDWKRPEPSIDWSKQVVIDGLTFNVDPQCPITIKTDGRVILKCSVDESAKAFWAAVQRMGLEMCRRKTDGE